MSDQKSEVTLFATRSEIISDPLKEYFNVILGEQLTANKDNKISKFCSVQSHLSETDGPVIIDSLGTNNLAISKLASRYGNTVYLRPRGGFWGEYKDRRLHSGTFREHAQVAKKRFIRDRIVAEADHIVPVSHFLKTQIKHTYPGLDTPMDVVYPSYHEDAVNPSERNQALRDEWGIPNKASILLSVTSFYYRSKIEGLIDFAPALNDFLIDHDLVFFIVAGSGIHHEEFELRFRQHLDNDIQNRVIFTGFLSPIAPAYAAADLFVHLSYRDTLAKTVVEAQVSGLPVVVNTGGGMPEAVNPNGKGNAVIRTNDELRSHLDNLIENETSLPPVGDGNAKWARSKFHATTIAEEFRRIL